MELKIFTVYDSKTEAYMPPFFMQSTGQAMRSFEDTINHEKEHVFGKHPEDFTLFELGKFDDQTSTFNLHKTSLPLAKAIELCIKSD